VNLKKTVFFKRSDLIPLKLASGIAVSIYNGRRFQNLHVREKMVNLPFRSYIPSTVYGSKIQQKWAEKRQKQLIKVKKK